MKNDYPNWKIQDIWNELVTEERKPEPRNYIRASEIGQPFLDRYLRMKGAPVTNPFSARTLRIFDCGKIFETEVVERMFKILGILICSQGEKVIKNEGLCDVIGHHDPKVGGRINIEKAMAAINHKNTPEWLKLRATALLQKLTFAYPDGMRILTTEIKTVNSNAFHAHKNTDKETGFFKGYDHHKLQLWTYLNNDEEGRLFYISKDDLLIMEASVFKNNKELEEKWFEDIKTMSHYYLNDIEPPKEPDFVYNENKGRWEVNWKIGRSNYLTYITGKENQDEWERSLYPKLKELNSKPCKMCKTVFSLTTLDKYEGHCAKCYKKFNKKKGGDENEDKSDI